MANERYIELRKQQAENGDEFAIRELERMGIGINAEPVPPSDPPASFGGVDRDQRMMTIARNSKSGWRANNDLFLPGSRSVQILPDWQNMRKG